MFTGLIDDVGTITRVDTTAAGRELHIECKYRDLSQGESIACNGACLTVLEHGERWFTVAAINTTLERTTIGQWKAGGKVNLERALRVGDRLGGHFVQGHVDGLGVVEKVRQQGDARLIDLALPPGLPELTVQHGSIAVDGVSLTVNEVLGPSAIQLSLIDFTMRHTTLGELEIGSGVHIEADMLAKHVQRLIRSGTATG